jgi:hypothetical protein
MGLEEQTNQKPNWPKLIEEQEKSGLSVRCYIVFSCVNQMRITENCRRSLYSFNKFANVR